MLSEERWLERKQGGAGRRLERIGRHPYCRGGREISDNLIPEADGGSAKRLTYPLAS